MSNELIEQPQQTNVGNLARTIAVIEDIRKLVAQQMEPEKDYGIIPGTKKPTLFQPGAQKILSYFNCYPELQITRFPMENHHLEVQVMAYLIHRETGQKVGCGIGSASTMEDRYRFRNAERKCPACGKEAIIKGKAEYGGGWLCWQKKGGCNGKWPAGAKEIEGQEVGKVENPNPSNEHNTVLKMSAKRALVNAALTLGCMSEYFTQDMEDSGGEIPNAVHNANPEPPKKEEKAGEFCELDYWTSQVKKTKDAGQLNAFCRENHKFLRPGDMQQAGDAAKRHATSINCTWNAADKEFEDYKEPKETKSALLPETVAF